MPPLPFAAVIQDQPDELPPFTSQSSSLASTSTVASASNVADTS